MRTFFRFISNSCLKLTQGSINRQIFGAALVVAVTTALAKLALVAKELVVAWYFGVSNELDAFFIALIVPYFLTNVVSGSFNSALIPTFIHVRHAEGLPSAQRLFSNVLVFSLLLLLMFTMLMVATAPVYLPWMARGFSQEKLDLTWHLLLGISPWLIMSGMITTWGAVLNAGESFALAAVTPTITPILTIIFLLNLESWGIYSLVMALICGGGLELVVLGIGLKKKGITILPIWYGLDDNLRQVIGQYLPMISGSFLMSSTTLVDQSMAAMLSPGSVTALNYGNKLIAFPLGLCIIALSTSMIPYLSKMTAKNDWQNLRHTITKYIKWIFLSTLPMVVCLIVTSESLIRIVFQRGSVTAADTQIISQIQSCYALQIPFSISGIIVVRAVSSLKSNHILLLAAILNLTINIALNYLFIQWIGIAGIALSTSCVMCCSMLYVSYHLFQKINSNLNEQMEKTIW